MQIPWFMKKLIAGWLCVTSPPHLARWTAAVTVIPSPELAHFQSNIPKTLNHPLECYPDLTEYVYTRNFSNMVKICGWHVHCFVRKKKSFHEHQLQPHCDQYHQKSINEEVFIPQLDFATCWQEWTQTIMVRLEYLCLNSHQRASQLIIYWLTMNLVDCHVKLLPTKKP